MNKNDLVEAVAGHAGDRRAAAAVVEAVLGTVMRAVRDGERVALSGFGVFEKVDRAARSARNPSTGATVAVPATSAPRFRPGQVFKDVVSGQRELPEGAVRLARTGRPAPNPAVQPAPDLAPELVAEPVVEPGKKPAKKAVEKPDAKKPDAKKPDAKKPDAKKPKSDAKKAAPSKDKKKDKKAGKK